MIPVVTLMCLVTAIVSMASIACAVTTMEDLSRIEYEIARIERELSEIEQSNAGRNEGEVTV